MPVKKPTIDAAGNRMVVHVRSILVKQFFNKKEIVNIFQLGIIAN